MRTHEESSVCSIAGALNVLGEKWTLLIIRECFYGSTRFEQFHQVLKCPRNLLSERLAMLVEEGVLQRSEYREPGRRARLEYQLSDKGLELMHLMVAVMHWGDRHTAGPEGAPVLTRHVGCGGDLDVVFQCTRGHTVTDPVEVEMADGPGALPLVTTR